MSDDTPEADRAPGAPHPRHAARVVGQDAAEAAFLEAYTSDRMHHSWLITGPRGIGKATLAWRIARFLLTTPDEDGGLFGAPPPPTTLEPDPSHPALPRLSALSEPRLFLLRRPFDEKKEQLKTEITVDEVRRLKGFFTMSAADGGRRVVIIDAADEMNTSAANAVLKLLEEPPADTVMLLISHQPSRLLPTIRSRCRALRCRTLDGEEIANVLHAAEVDSDADPVALAELASGSAGAAVRLLAQDGMTTYAALLALFSQGYDRQAALRLADGLAGRANADKLDLLLELFDLMLTRLARHGLRGPSAEAAPGETALFDTFCPYLPGGNRHASLSWAELQQTLSQRARHGQSVNLDPAALILDITFKIHQRAADMAPSTTHA